MADEFLKFSGNKSASIELGCFSGDSDPNIWVFQAERYFTFYGFSKDSWLSFPSLYSKGEALAWFNWLYSNDQFYDWKHFTEILAYHYNKQIGLSSVTDLLLKMNKNCSHMRHHLDNIQNTLSACSQKFVDTQARLAMFVDTQARLDMPASLDDKYETEEVPESEIASDLDDGNSNPTDNFEVSPEVLEPPINVEKDNLEVADKYLSFGHLEPLLIPIGTAAEAVFAMDAKDGAATDSEGGEHHMFDEFPQRNEMIYLHSTLIHNQVDPSLANFGDLAMCESMKDGLPTCYWFDTGQHLSIPIPFVFLHKKCGDLLSVLEFGKIGDCLASFDTQDGGVMLVGHDEILLSGDAHRKYMWCFEFVVMKQSSHSAQTRPRYFLLFLVVQKSCYILGRANRFGRFAYSYSMTKVWDLGLTSSADMLVGIVLLTLIERCQRTADCLMIFDKIPQRCVVCWIGWIEAYEQAENCEEVSNLFYFIQHGYVIFGRLSIVICNANPFIGMNFNCGSSSMFNTCHFLLMVSLNNRTSSSTFIPYAIVHIRNLVYDQAVREQGKLESNILPSHAVKDPRHVRRLFVYVQLWAFDSDVVGVGLYNSNLEDKVLIGAGGIVMNGPRPVSAKQPNTILSGYVWDPG